MLSEKYLSLTACQTGFWYNSRFYFSIVLKLSKCNRTILEGIRAYINLIFSNHILQFPLVIEDIQTYCWASMLNTFFHIKQITNTMTILYIIWFYDIFSQIFLKFYPESYSQYHAFASDWNQLWIKTMIWMSYIKCLPPISLHPKPMCTKKNFPNKFMA